MPRSGGAGRWHGVFRPQRRPTSPSRIRARLRPEALLAVPARSARAGAMGLAIAVGVAAGATVGPVAGVAAATYVGVAAAGALRALRVRATERNVAGAG